MNINRTNRALVLTVLLIASATSFSQSKPSVVSPDLNRGIEFYQHGNYADASKLLKKVVKENKTDGTAWYYLGLTLTRRKQSKEAVKALETAVTLEPNSASAHVALGYALLLRNREAVALHESLKALAIDPGLVDGHYISGIAYLRLGKQDLALQAADSALQKNPNFAVAYLLKSQALVAVPAPSMPPRVKGTRESARQRYSQAREALEKYLQLNPNDEDKALWTEQLASFRFFEAAPTGTDEAPYLGSEVTVKARIFSKPEPSYTESARVNGITGTVVLRAVFGADGTIKHILVLRSLPEGLTEKAISAARRIKFVPAQLDGRPVSMFLQLEYSFNLY
jgi:TonB family protein